MSNTEQIHVRIGTAKKESWEEYLEREDTVNSMADLVRFGVSNYMNTTGATGHPKSASSEGEGTPMGDNSEVLEKLTNIETALSDLGERVGNVERELSRSPEIKDVMTKVFAVLPPQPYGSQEHHFERNFLHADKEKRIAWEGTIEDISDTINVDRQWVELALERLQEDTERVKTTASEGRTRAWKEEGHSSQRYEQFSDYNPDEDWIEDARHDAFDGIDDDANGGR